MSTIISRDERILGEMNRREQAVKRLQGSYKFWIAYSTLIFLVYYLSGERPSWVELAFCICFVWTKVMQWCVRVAFKKIGYRPPKWLPKNEFTRLVLSMIPINGLLWYLSKSLPPKSEHPLGELNGRQLALRMGSILSWVSAFAVVVEAEDQIFYPRCN